MAQDISLLGATYPDVPAVNLPKSGGGTATFYDLADVNYAESEVSGGSAVVAAGIPYGVVDGTSTSTAYTATVDGIHSLYDGVTVLLKNGVITSAAGFTININGLGAKPVYSNMAAATAETTIFNINYTMLFVYDSTRVSGGCWICYRGYDTNTNTIGYQLRTQNISWPLTDRVYRYRLLFQSADGAHWVPSNTATSTNATAARAVCQTPINPFGPISYYAATAALTAGTVPAAGNLWWQYSITLGYSFNRTGAALTLTTNKPVYVKCAPQSDGSAIIDADTPYVQDLPTTEDGKIYILLGSAYSATNIEFLLVHPVYYYKDSAIRLWTNPASSGGGSTVSVTQVQTSGTKIATVSVDGSGTDLYAPTPPTASTTAPSMDGTASYGSGTEYARSNHVHPTDTSRQATLVSGTNIKTINSNSLLGSGNLSLATLPSVSSSDNDKILKVVSGAWAAATNSGGGGVSVITTTVTIATSDWSNNACTKNVTGVTASNAVLVTYAPASKAVYTAADIYCSAQGAGTLTFGCTTTPSASVTVNVMIIEGG